MTGNEQAAADRLEWLRSRQTGVGASDVAALAGLSPWASPMSVWVDKTQAITADDQTEAQWLGLLVENAILDGFEQTTGHEVTHRQIGLQGPRPWHKATPDGMVDGTDPIDAKFIGDKPWNDDGTADGIPDHYMVQSLWQTHCAGADRGYLVAIHTAFGRRQFRSYLIPKNPELVAALVSLVDNFWERYVIPKQLPPVDGSDATKQALSVLYPHETDRGTETEIDADEVAMLENAKAAADQANRWAEACKQRIVASIGDAAIGTVNGVPVFTYRAQTRRATPAAAVNAARKTNPRALAWLPETETTFRVLRAAPKPKANK